MVRRRRSVLDDRRVRVRRRAAHGHRAARTRRQRFTLALLVLTSLTLISLDARGFRAIDTVRDGVLGALGPVRDLANGVGDRVSSAVGNVSGSEDLREENRRLRRRVEDLEGRVARQESAERTLEQLQDEVGIPYVGDVPTVMARVTAGPVSNFERTVEIDRGSRAGIRVGMPVVTSGGLVGAVERTSATRSVVRLLTDAEFRVGVRIDEESLGLASGGGPGAPVRVEMGVDPTHPVREGMLATTSGLEGSRFPAGVPVGRVTRVTPRGGGLDLDVTLRPLADLDDLAFLTVVRWSPPS